MKNWKRLFSALVAVFMLLTMPIMTGVSRAVADSEPEDGTLTIKCRNVGGNPDDEFNYTMTLTIDPTATHLSISDVTQWIDRFLKDGGQLFSDEEKEHFINTLINYLLGVEGTAGEPIVIESHFTLKGGETATIQNMEGGIAYEITQAAMDGYTPSVNGQTGNIGEALTVNGVIDGNMTVAFKNTFGTALNDGTLTIKKVNAGGVQEDQFNYTMVLTIDPTAADLSISDVTSWIDKFLKDGGQLFSDEEKEHFINTLINYLLGVEGAAGEPIVIESHFTLKGGETATIVDLEGGIAYEITETGAMGYAPSANGQTGNAGEDLTVSGVIDGDVTITFTNTFVPEDGTLTISKTNVGGNQDDEFNYTMTLTIDPTLTELSISDVTGWIDKFLKDGGQLFSDEEKEHFLQTLINYLLGSEGSAGEPLVIESHFTLKGGETATIVNMEGGIAYEITEAGMEGYVPSANGQYGPVGGSLTVSGVINGDSAIEFTNTYSENLENGTLTISKVNDGGDPDDEFNYTLTLIINPATMDLSISDVTGWIDKFLKDGGQLFSDEEKEHFINTLINYLLGADGTAGEPIVIESHFTLKGGETATIQDMEGGIAYVITEAGTEGYTPSANDQTGTLGSDLTVNGVIDGDTAITFTNKYVPEDGTLTITKTNVGGNQDDEFNYTMTLTIDPTTMDLSISDVTGWIDRFLKDGGQLFSDEEKEHFINTLINYLLGVEGSAGEPLVIESHFTLKGGETATIVNMEGGIAYVITEEGTEGYTPSANGQTGNEGDDLTVSGVIDGDTTIAFTNTFGTIPEDGTLTITKENVGGNQNDVFNFTMVLTIDPTTMDLSISDVTQWIDRFLKDGGQLFSDEEKENFINTLINYLLGVEGTVGEPIVIESHFTLKGGETATIPDMEGGIEYSITEAGTAGYTPSANDQTGELGGSLTVTGIIDGDATVAFVNTFDDNPEFRTHSLMLDGKIGINFYMYLPDSDAFEYDRMDFTISGKDGQSTSVPYSRGMKRNRSGELYGFVYYVNTIQMADTITAKFYYTKNGEEKMISETYSVLQYFLSYDTAYEANPTLFPVDIVNMITATADLGHYVQKYLDKVRPEWQVPDDHADMYKFYTTYTDADLSEAAEYVAPYALVAEGNTPDVALSYKLELESEMALRVILVPKNGYTGSITATLDGANCAVTPVDGLSKYIVECPNVKAHQLSKTHTFVITTENGSVTIKGSGLSYAHMMLQMYRNDPDGQHAAIAIYRYSKFADILKPEG